MVFKRPTHKLRRSYWGRYHLFRSLATQLIEHERIKTTYAKARALQPIADRLLAYAKKEDRIVFRKRVNGLLTTPFARKKIFLELAPRLKDRNGAFTRVQRLDYRQGDGAPTAYIEILGNEIEKYEKALEKQNIESKLVPNNIEFEKKIFTQERDFFMQKLSEVEQDAVKLDASIEAKLNEGKGYTETDAARDRKNLEVRRKFFENKLKRAEHDIWILNKDKYDLIKYVPIS